MKKVLIVFAVVTLLGCMHFIFSGRKLDKPETYANLSDIKAGAKVYADLKCDSCHSVDGSDKTGGTLKDIMWTEATLTDGSKVMRDELYIRESILMPAAKIVKDRKGTMMDFTHIFKDQENPRQKELDTLVAYIKSLSPAPREKRRQSN